MSDSQLPTPLKPKIVESALEKQAAFNFEDRLQEVEALAERLKDAEIPLTEATNLFEHGMKLARLLSNELAKIERRIEIMTNDPEITDDTPDLELFSESEVSKRDIPPDEKPNL